MLTLPRIPQIYYGTEILMDDFDKPWRSWFNTN